MVPIKEVDDNYIYFENTTIAMSEKNMFRYVAPYCLDLWEADEYLLSFIKVCSIRNNYMSMVKYLMAIGMGVDVSDIRISEHLNYTEMTDYFKQIIDPSLWEDY